MSWQELGERVAAIEMELHMRAPRHAELERSMAGITRQMDRVVTLGTQALEEIGTLTDGLSQLQTELHAHIRRPFVQIIRDRWLEITPWVFSAGMMIALYPEAVARAWLNLIGAMPD